MASEGPRRDIGLAAVAELAGLSTATVSNTLNRPHLVSPATRDRVMAAIDELQFVPNRAASDLRKGRGRLIGLVIPEIVNPFYAALAGSVGAAALERGYLLGLCVSGDDPDVEAKHLAMLAEQRAAGALVVPLAADEARLDRLRLVGSHPVLIDRAWQIGEGCSVTSDDRLGGHLAIEHLLATTEGPLYIVNGPTSIPQCADRGAGAFAALAKWGVPEARLHVLEVAEMTRDAGMEAAQKIDEDAGCGVFATNDQLAVGVMRGLARAGRSVPEDVRVVGYGDLAIASESLIPLTTIRQPKQELGSAAVELLLDEIESPQTHRHQARVLEPTLVLRDSSPV